MVRTLGDFTAQPLYEWKKQMRTKLVRQIDGCYSSVSVWHVAGICTGLREPSQLVFIAANCTNLHLK